MEKGVYLMSQKRKKPKRRIRLRPIVQKVFPCQYSAMEIGSGIWYTGWYVHEKIVIFGARVEWLDRHWLYSGAEENERVEIDPDTLEEVQ